MLLEKEYHAEMAPLYKKLYRDPECKLERKFEEEVSRLLTKIWMKVHIQNDSFPESAVQSESDAQQKLVRIAET